MPELCSRWSFLMGYLFSLVFSTLILLPIKLISQVKTDNLIDYTTLDHSIVVESIRAGNHDTSGLNSYFFSADMHAMAVRTEDRGKTFEERLKVSRELGRFGEKTIKALAFWRPDEDNQPALSIEGDLIRNLISDSMREFSLPEQQIAILVQIRMYEENKKFVFLGEDTFVGEAKYFIIPEALPHSPLLENKTLEIADNLGTFVRLKTNYQLIEARASR